MRSRRLLLLALLLSLGVPGAAHAQGSRKDDIVLNRFGQPVAGASVTVCTSGATGTPCSPLASIFSDVALAQPLSNPLTSDGQGNYHFYAAPARYLLQISGAGVAATTIPDVLLPADPTSPSFQTLNVAQNISALNLNLSGNLTVSGGVSSPSTLSAPQQGSAAPVQIGPHWYAGTAGGKCTAPAAPTVAVETYSSGTGTIGTASYQYKVALYNRNGITNMGPAATFAAPSGSTNRILVQLGAGDYSYRSGCYGYRVYVSSDGGNTFWQQNAWTLPAASISSWSRNAAGLVTVITTASHGFVPGESIAISGAATGGISTSINGTFTLVGQQVNSPTTLFFFQSSSLGADSSSTAQGTGTVVAGLGADPAGHLAPGDFILSTILTSGTQGPTTNTAAIDPIQVALNATCNYTTNSCNNGQYDVPQGTATLTTPLIVSNQQTVTGVNGMGAGGKSSITCNWADPNVGCIMVMGVANGVRIEGLFVINSSGHVLELVGWGPGLQNFNQTVQNNTFGTGDTTGQYSAVYFHGGVWYNEHFKNNYLGGSLAAVQIDAASGSWWFFQGSRWNCSNGFNAASGISGNGLLSVSSPTDPDRAQNHGNSTFPNAVAMVELSDLFTESVTGVQVDAVNLGLHLKKVNFADPSVVTGTPAAVRIGNDTNSGSGNFGDGVSIEDSVLTSTATCLQYIAQAQGFQTTLRNMVCGQTHAIDCNNLSCTVVSDGSGVSALESGGGNVINAGAQSEISIFGSPSSNAAPYTNSWSGLTRALEPGAYGTTTETYFGYGTSAAFSWYGGIPTTASNLYQSCSFVSGANCTWYQNDGATPIFAVKPAGGANTICMFNAADCTTTANFLSIGKNFRWNNTSSGVYFQMAGTPTAARTITWPDASGTVAFVLSGTSGSLGGSALTAGTCSSTTVTISGAATSMVATASPVSDPGSGFYWLAFVSSSNTVTVRICAAASATPTSTAYNVRVIQ